MFEPSIGDKSAGPPPVTDDIQLSKSPFQLIKVKEEVLTDQALVSESSTSISDSDLVPPSQSVVSLALINQSNYVSAGSSPNSSDSAMLSPMNSENSVVAIPNSSGSINDVEGGASNPRYRMPYSSSDQPYNGYGQRVYECTICHWKFKIRQHLTRHMLSHTDEKRFECEVCGKTFNRKSNMKNHRKIHAGYTCEKCNQHFTSLKDYRAHEEEDKCPKLSEPQSALVPVNSDAQKDTAIVPKKITKSADSKGQIFRCNICNTMYGYQAGLKRHMRQKHSQGTVAVKPKHACPICGKVFERPYRLYVHFNKLHRTAFAEPAVRQAIQALEPREDVDAQHLEVQALLDANDNMSSAQFSPVVKEEVDGFQPN